jgi:hypothetical protein
MGKKKKVGPSEDNKRFSATILLAVSIAKDVRDKLLQGLCFTESYYSMMTSISLEMAGIPHSMCRAFIADTVALCPIEYEGKTMLPLTAENITDCIIITGEQQKYSDHGVRQPH